MAVHTNRSSSPGVPTGWLTSTSTKPLVNRPSQAGGPGEPRTMRHANYVGRHGALVVPLGIGMAVATMPGIALAEPNSGSSTSSSDSSSSSSSGSSVRMRKKVPPMSQTTLTTYRIVSAVWTDAP
jgi:hypothetical protein